MYEEVGFSSQICRCTVEMKTNQTQKILEYASIEDVNVLSSLLSGATEEEINFQDKVRRSTSIFI